MFTFLDQRKQTKMQWLQDRNHNKVDNVNAVVTGSKPQQGR